MFEKSTLSVHPLDLEELRADQFAFEVTSRVMADGWVEDDQQFLPDLEELEPSSYLAMILTSVDRSKLNGYDLVRLLQARERMVAYSQAGAIADTHEIAYASPGNQLSPVAREEIPSEFAADELRPALCLTRRAAENRMGLALDLRERLPRVWELLDKGLIDLARARVFADGTSHVSQETGRRVVELLAEVAPRLTTGQLRARIRRLCIEADHEDARKRRETALGERLLMIEPTVDGTANVHILDIDMADARAFGRRVNAHMISLRREGDDRTHDNLRADIAVDFLLGSDPTVGGRGMVDVNIDLATLAGLDERAAEIPGMGPVLADVARQIVDRRPEADWRCTVIDDQGRVVDVVTTSRRPTKTLSRHVEATQPVCSFPGCRVPAVDCDFDHLIPWSVGGATSAGNGGPKCRHDHVLKDNGWAHERIDGEDVWTSPLGHVHTTERPL